MNHPEEELDTPYIDLQEQQGNIEHEASSEPAVGSLVNGKYKLNSLIGEGGMSAVYKATDVLLNRQVAIKFLLSHRAFDKTNLQRFNQEARAASCLEHTNIVKVHEFTVPPQVRHT